MPKEEIVEGLRQAVSKGQPLEKAMISFYNSGYTQEEIEEAANALKIPQPQYQYQPEPTKNSQTQKPQQPVQQQPVQQPTSQPVPQQVAQPQQPTQQIQQQQNFRPLAQPLPPGSGVVQRVSAYGKPYRPGKTITIVLFIILFLLICILAAVILFKDELVTFFSNLFWKALF